jgi:hypothetical protein
MLVVSPAAVRVQLKLKVPCLMLGTTPVVAVAAAVEPMARMSKPAVIPDEMLRVQVKVAVIGVAS